MKPKRKLTRFVGAALVAALLLPTSVFAIEYGGVGGRPANPDPAVPRSSSIFIYTIDRGQSRTDAITVINNTQERKTLQIYAVDSVVASGGAISCEQQADRKNEVGEWINLTQSEVVLDPLTNTEVPFTVNVPSEKVSPGEHNGCIVVQAKDQQPTRQPGGIALTTRTGIRVAITIPGDIERAIQWSDSTVTKRKDRPGYILQAQLKNTGNVSIESDLKARTSLLWWPKIEEHGGEFNVLPFTTGEFNFELEKPFWGLLYRSKPTVTYDADPGEGEEARTLAGPVRWFWVWPHPLAALIELAVLALLVFGGTYAIRERRFRKSLPRWTSRKVKSGETLGSIAKERGTTVRRLAKVNNVTRAYEPKAGETLKVPPKR